MQHMGRLLALLSRSSVSYKRIAAILKEPQESPAIISQDKGKSLSGEIQFKDVWFSYEEGRPVLKNINLSISPGEVVALLGEAGSGKTSLVNLLPRFYDHSRGEILLDGNPLESYAKHILRESIGIVEQEPFLFSMSIKENIAYGMKREVKDHEIEDAARAAAIHSSIMDFPDGYDTVIGEKGVTLSGGQKQRIAIARAVLKNPRILILDDATSSIDGETEEKIREALRGLMQGKTTFIIAHRIRSLMMADTILVFQQGEIIERGTHQELIKARGFYSKVFELQTQIETELEQELV
jgi:ATP-binding cassette subfamily B protein